MLHQAVNGRNLPLRTGIQDVTDVVTITMLEIAIIGTLMEWNHSLPTSMGILGYNGHLSEEVEADPFQGDPTDSLAGEEYIEAQVASAQWLKISSQMEVLMPLRKSSALTESIMNQYQNRLQ